MVVTRRVDDAVDAFTAARPWHLQVTAWMLTHESGYFVNSGQFNGIRRKSAAQSLMYSDARATMGKAAYPVQLFISGQIIGRNAGLQQLVAQCGIPSPGVNAAMAQIANLADGNRQDVEMMVMEPAAVPFNRAIVRNGDIGASGCQPRRQQPQVMTELASKWRRSVIVRPMG